ncbi:MAG: hypothetical protein ACRDFS_02625, partial [Chloroflexota bacterium]
LLHQRRLGVTLMRSGGGALDPMRGKYLNALTIGLLALLFVTLPGVGWAHGSVPRGKGVIVGGISPCVGLPIYHGPRYAAGVVTVFRGRIRREHMRSGGYRWSYPTHVVARQRVRTNGTYRFVLSPGWYVLEARYLRPSNMHPFTRVKLHRGAIVHRGIPDLCKQRF